ncbi:MAG: DegT/DnrJ/EryC1/StrS family aminotransferase, partial [Syntrophobacteraceae bacterium]
MHSIPVMGPSLKGNEAKYLQDAVESTWIGGAGEYIERVEREWAEICGTRECVTASNGTVSLHMALLALGAGPGDEVIVPALTYVATANAVQYVGAEPVFVDVDPNTWCIDPKVIEASITPRTKGVMPVHLQGHPADVDAIKKLAALYKLWILCDAAQAHMATYKGQTVGSLGDIESFSFHVSKIFTCGEGGAITLNDSKLAKWLRLVRGHGMDPERRFFHPMTAFNYRLTNMQAAVLCAQLERREVIISRRRQFFKRYENNLRDTPGICFQPMAEWAVPCPWVFSILIDESEFGYSRDQLMAALSEQGIETRPFYFPLHKLPPYRQKSAIRGDTCPVAERLSQIGMFLPSSTDITDAEVDFVCETIRIFAQKRANR